MKKALLAGAFVLAAGAAHAGDWTGGYVGAGLGYGVVDVSNNVPGGEDYMFGLHGGYRYDFGDWVVGGELEYDWSDIDVANNTVTLDNVSRLKLNLGYDFGPGMSYLIVGAAEAYTSGLGDDSGYLYGIGAAYQVTEQWIVSGEVLQHDFDDFNASGLDVEATTVNFRASFRF
ncbi:outer membrane protein [Sedimentitalea arenosa]|jgi:opacity protein-like surface antigen|uniref:Porin family protein n=1 Tax=Sedimentitalea arenosa TaxID=2798803 RepID=A0A8J7J733_9RHOB|nr:porin family protein [Arenibacterium arenosum]MBJ6370313.1 porin family protein [Arenibacterium arenosum]